MEIVCKFVCLLDKREGESKEGNPWVRQNMLVQSMDGNDRKMAITAFGERRVAKMAEFRNGDVLKLNFGIESRPNAAGDKWFTELQFIDAERLRYEQPPQK